jgi:hypothetical protein
MGKVPLPLNENDVDNDAKRRRDGDLKKTKKKKKKKKKKKAWSHVPSSKANCYSRVVPKTSPFAATPQAAVLTLINEFIGTAVQESRRLRTYCSIPF